MTTCLPAPRLLDRIRGSNIDVETPTGAIARPCVTNQTLLIRAEGSVTAPGTSWTFVVDECKTNSNPEDWRHETDFGGYIQRRFVCDG